MCLLKPTKNSTQYVCLYLPKPIKLLRVVYPIRFASVLDKLIRRLCNEHVEFVMKMKIVFACSTFVWFAY